MGAMSAWNVGACDQAVAAALKNKAKDRIFRGMRTSYQFSSIKTMRVRSGLIQTLRPLVHMSAAPHTAPRILHIASWYPSAVHGTLGNFVERHVQAIATRCRGEVWYAAPVPAQQTVPANSMRDCGNYTERIFYFRARKPAVQQVTTALLKAAQSTEPFDLIHLHVAYPAGKAARKLARQWNVPLVVTEHWTAYHADQRRALPFWRRHSMLKTGRAAAALCPVSEDLAASMRDFGINGTYCPVPNVVDTALFHPAHGMRHGETYHALHISSLRDDQKNISGMLRAFGKALAACPNLRISIIGDGDPEPHLRYARELGIVDRIEIAGEISLTEVAERMRAADALILFSRFENFPCVIPEAWGSGIPVLSTDVGGIREHLTPDRGALVANEDETALSATLTAWAQGNATFEAEAMRQYAETTFSVAAVANAYHGVYLGVLK